MILSSADILRVLGGDPVIRQEARLSIVDDKPGIGLDEYVYIYVQRYPSVDEFEATWKIWIQDGGSDVLDLVLAAMTRMLPNFDYHKTHYSTTDFKSDRTEVEPEEELEFTEQDELNARFKLLSDEVLKKVNGLRDGLDGIDGLTGPQGPAGRDGVDGRDGKDIDATDTDLEDLRNVEQGIPYEKGQVLTWDGTKWTNLYVQQVFKSGGGGGGSGGGVTQIVAGSNVTIDPVEGVGVVTINAGATATPDGGDFGGLPNPDGGDFDTGTTTSTIAYPVDGGDFNTGETGAFGDTAFNGGLVT